ncbi:hypothetical protein [Adhaeribacter soli]|uniref:Uncharacterized protein n=1 Tax=Adhaeribacter soli TaxID=2607655 RepID=A0A5N1J135_9BACT|nr:hypothetical protein [Adhaeribacter soli]KAA9340144.1 hypothetical protein F0P94_07285 [Adhaeribacter soli]
MFFKKIKNPVTRIAKKGLSSPDNHQPSSYQKSQITYQKASAYEVVNALARTLSSNGFNKNLKCALSKIKEVKQRFMIKVFILHRFIIGNPGLILILSKAWFLSLLFHTFYSCLN